MTAPRLRPRIIIGGLMANGIPPRRFNSNTPPHLNNLLGTITLTVYGHQEGAKFGCNPRQRGRPGHVCHGF